VLWKLPEISAPPETLFFIGPLPITNSLLLSIISGVIVITFFLLATRNPKLIPRPLQNLIEWMTQGLLNICEEVAGRENGRRFFKWVAAIFFLIAFDPTPWWVDALVYVAVAITVISGVDYFFGLRRMLREADERRRAAAAAAEADVPPAPRAPTPPPAAQPAPSRRP